MLKSSVKEMVRTISLSRLASMVQVRSTPTASRLQAQAMPVAVLIPKRLTTMKMPRMKMTRASILVARMRMLATMMQTQTQTITLVHTLMPVTTVTGFA